MSNKMNNLKYLITRFLFGGFLLLSLMGCRLDEFLNLPTYFSGEKEENGILKEVTVVNFGLRKNNGVYQMTFQAFSSDGAVPDLFTLRFKDGNDKILWIDFIQPLDASIALKIDGSCAFNSENETRLCWEKENLNLDFKLNESRFRYQFKRFDDGVSRVKAPERVSVQQLINLTRMRNFSNLTEAEIVYQAKESILETRGNLLPHFNMKDLISVVTDGPIGLLGNIGELLPFIFPTPWLDWSKSSDLYQAQLLSFSSLLANEMNAVETLVYSVHRDIALSHFLDKQLQLLIRVESRTKKLEELGVLKAGASLDFSLKMKSYQQDRRQLQTLIDKELSALAYAVGYSPTDNGFTLDEIQFDEPTKPAESAAELAQLALIQSMEVRSLSFLSQAANKDISNRSYGFLDPSSDISIGFGRAPSTRIGKSQKKKIEIQKASVTALIEKRAVEVSADMNEAYDLYRSSLLASNDADRRYNQLIGKPMELGEISWAEPTVISLVLESLDNKLRYEAMKLSALHAFQIAKANRNRLVLDGFQKGLAIVDVSPTGTGE